MQLPYEDWLEEAERLPEGRERRIGHLCGDGNVLVIGHTSEGYRAWCHRCHAGGFKPHGRRSLDEQLKQWREADAKIDLRTSVTLPTGCSGYDAMSRRGLVWLARGGITRTLANKYGIRYHSASARVILPVYQAGKLVYYQARAVEPGQNPKYLNPKVDRAAIRFVSATSHCGETCVVVEDVLSAIRVGEVQGYTGCSILGTKASAADINFISRFKRVYLWFDPDEAGRECTKSVKRSLALVGKESRIITSSRDPKLYTHSDLERILNEVN